MCVLAALYAALIVLHGKKLQTSSPLPTTLFHVTMSWVPHRGRMMSFVYSSTFHTSLAMAWTFARFGSHCRLNLATAHVVSPSVAGRQAGTPTDDFVVLQSQHITVDLPVSTLINPRLKFLRRDCMNATPKKRCGSGWWDKGSWQFQGVFGQCTNVSRSFHYPLATSKLAMATTHRQETMWAWSLQISRRSQ